MLADETRGTWVTFLDRRNDNSAIANVREKKTTPKKKSETYQKKQNKFRSKGPAINGIPPITNASA